MFGGFKVTLNLLSRGKKKNEFSELSTDMFVTGAYRVNKEDLYGFSTQDPIRPRTSKQSPPPLRQSRSTSNLVQPKTANPNLRKSTPAISTDPRGAEHTDRNSVPSRKEIKKPEKEQKKLEKQRLAEQRKQAQEQAKTEKSLKVQAKKEAQKAKASKNVKKKILPAPVQKTPTPPPPSQPQNQAQAVPQNKPQNLPQSQPKVLPQNKPQSQPAQAVLRPDYSTNTLDSSISRTSGPPPYSELPAQGSNDKSGNVVYSKPVDSGSWDLISQHREQMSRPTTAASMDTKRKQMVMDLNYNFGASNDDKQNSDA